MCFRIKGVRDNGGYVSFDTRSYAKTKMLVIGFYWMIITGLPLDLAELRTLVDEKDPRREYLEERLLLFLAKNVPGTTEYILSQQIAAFASTVTEQHCEVERT